MAATFVLTDKYEMKDSLIVTGVATLSADYVGGETLNLSAYFKSATTPVVNVTQVNGTVLAHNGGTAAAGKILAYEPDNGAEKADNSNLSTVTCQVIAIGKAYQLTWEASPPTLIRWFMKKYAKDLFPQLDVYRDYWEKREYVESVLIGLANKGALFLTDIANQPRAMAKDLAGQVLCGTMIQDNRYTDAPVPPELEDYRVKIKPVGDNNIRYEHSWKIVGKLQNNLPMLEKVYREPRVGKDGTASFTVSEAWKALWRYGKEVRPAKSSNLQAKLWRYEEVRPENGNVQH